MIRTAADAGKAAAKLDAARRARPARESGGLATPTPAIGQRAFVAGLWTTALGTLASRVLGLVRDMATAALLGESLVMDALVIALRVPNLFRRLFGEGALTACYVPVLAEELERDRDSARRLANAVVSGLAWGLAGVVLVGEGVCAAAWFCCADATQSRLVIGLTATLLPYLWFICIAAQLAATLQSLGRFAAASCGAALLNVCWLAGVWWLAPRVSSDPATQAYTLAVCVLASGAAQVALQSWALAGCGFRFRLGSFTRRGGDAERREGEIFTARRLLWGATAGSSSSAEAARRSTTLLDEPAVAPARSSYRRRTELSDCRAPLSKIVRALAPLLAGLGVAQLSVLSDSVIAWLLAAPAGAASGVWWLGSLVDYPLQAGAASAIYYAERFYQLPVGLVGAAAATAVFPLLSRHAARNRPSAAAADLGQSLRLSWFAAMPMALGIGLLAEPLVRLTLQRGQFTSDDTRRAVGMIVMFAAGVWAFCALPTLARACYALGEYRTATRATIAAAGANFFLNLILIWPLAERGLALATTLSAAGQTVWLLAVLKNRYRQPWGSLLGNLTPTIIASAALTGSVLLLDACLPANSRPGAELARLCVLAASGAAVYLLVARMFGSRELTILWGGLKRRLVAAKVSKA